MKPSILAGILGALSKPLRVVTHYNSFPNTTYAHGTTLLKGFLRHEIFIGSGDVDGIAFQISNKLLSTVGAPINNGNSVTWEALAIESANANVANLSVPMPFPGGSRSRVVTAGEEDVLTQVIPPSAFGATKLTQGDRYYIKAMWAVPAAGNTVPCGGRRYNEASGVLLNGTVTFRCWVYDPAVTTPASIDSYGVWGSTPNVTGTAATPIPGQFSPCPAVVGTFVTPAGKKSTMLQGDSIAENSLGFCRYAMLNSANGVQASMNFSISGGHQSDMTWINTTYYKYFNVLMDETGINNTSDRTASYAISRPKARAGGIQKIIKTYVTPSTTSAQYSTTSVTYAGSGGITDVTVVTAGALPPVGRQITLAGATPAGLNGKKLPVLTSGSGQFTFQLVTNIGSGTATGTIIWGFPWNVEADQTYSDGGAAGNQGLFNNQVDADLSSGNIDAKVQMNSVRGVDPYKWKEQDVSLLLAETWLNNTTLGRHCQNSGYTDVLAVYDAVTVS